MLTSVYLQGFAMTLTGGGSKSQHHNDANFKKDCLKVAPYGRFVTTSFQYNRRVVESNRFCKFGISAVHSS